MKTSILIIAHNEEAHIRECIESILHQSQKADEIILVAHNCTDKTADIAWEYPKITVLQHRTTETWPIPAREYGFAHVTGNIVACIDGDSYVDRNWLHEILIPFSQSEVHSVSGFPILLWNPRMSYLWFLQWLPILKNIFDFYFWWGNFACRKSSYETVGGMSQCRDIWKNLHLHYPAEDCILSFLLQKEGKIVFIRKAKSYVYPGKYFDGTDRWFKQWEDLKKIREYFGR